jgi:primosomal protein N' (replication factor Y)
LVTLTERFGAATLPNVEIVDMKLFPNKTKEKTIIAPPLQAAISACLSNGKQIILFKNRRGYTPYRVCSACGWIPECKHCNISLTYHKYKNLLVCHFCSKEYALVNTCVACGNPHFEANNFGTEKIEEAVIEMFPKAKIGRMDMDTLKGKNAHSQLIQQFEMGKLDILIGTQMIVKGLDFENVQLVGILDADSMLNFADFRVNERAFQLMEQVSGRAGRKDNTGLVVIQTHNTKHPILQLVQQHDYTSFYTNEIEARKLFFYPPYSRLIHLQFKNKNQDVVQKAAHFFTKNIPANLQQYIIGPAEPTVNRLRNMYLMDLLFKLPKQTSITNSCKLAIQQTLALMQNTKEYSNTIIIPNVDPI